MPLTRKAAELKWNRGPVFGQAFLTPPNGPIRLVEDNETDVLLLERPFRKVSVRAPLQVVRGGLEATAYLFGAGSYADRASFPPAASVLLDLKLPKRSGFEVLEGMRRDSRFRDSPVIVLTSSSQTGDVIRAYELGALAYLVKPVGFDELWELAEILCRYGNAPHGEARAALDRISVFRPRA